MDNDDFSINNPTYRGYVPLWYGRYQYIPSDHLIRENGTLDDHITTSEKTESIDDILQTYDHVGQL